MRNHMLGLRCKNEVHGERDISLNNYVIWKERAMLKSILSGMVVALLLTNTFALVLGIQSTQSVSTTIVVPDDYTTIQEAINAANFGDRICVRAGTYPEKLVVSKTVSLVGENRGTTIIDGLGSGTVVYVTASSVNISGFTIQNSGVPTVWPAESGIILWYSDRSTITNCIITSNGGHGFCFVESRYYTISNSIVSNNNYIGIAVGDTGSSNGVIRNNTVYSNRLSGIEAYRGSDDTIVEDNTVYNNMMGIVFGWSDHCMIRSNRLYNNTASVLLDTTSYCTILNNSISYKQGIVLLGLGNYFNNILNNTVRFGEYGIGLGASAMYTTISGNVISRNEYGLFIAYNQGYPNYDNYIYHNDFVDNVVNARIDEDRYSNVWDDGYPSGGNYWSDYFGVDLYHGPYQNETGSDGIGDIPYVIDLNNQDGYPFLHPNGWLTNFRLSFSLMPNPAYVGQTVTMLGNLTDRLGNPINNIKVDLYVNGSLVKTPFTNSSGWFTASANVSLAGTYNVTVLFSAQDYDPSSHMETLTVYPKLDTKVTFTLSPNPAHVGQWVLMSGNLTDINDSPIGNAPLELYVRTGAGPWQYIGNISTDSLGRTWVFGRVMSAGTYQIAVVYRGSYKHNLSYHIETLTVNP